MNLSELKKGQKAKITSINSKGLIKRRLMDMGVLPGETVEVEKIAPLGDPIDIFVKGYHLSLRKSEAEQINVEVIE
jgi:Fe2+ transport system protein A